MPEINQDKKAAIRNTCRALRRAMPAEERAEADKIIAESVISLDAFDSCKTLLTYVSSPYEVDTRAVIAKALRIGKTVAVPVCVGNGQMSFYCIEGFESLRLGKYEIEEPEPRQENLVTDFNNCLCIVPGLSFDECGFRIGYGGGYYDRFLAENNVLSVGLCYESCVSSRLPHEIFDRRVELLITENRIRKTVGF